MPTLHLHHTVTGRHEPTPRALATAALFGLTLQPQATAELIPPTTLELVDDGTGQVIFITGTSGGGKSTLLRCIAEQLEQLVDHADFRRPRIWHLRGDESMPDAALVDGFDDLADRPIEGITPSLRWLGLAGLGDAHLMLHTPRQLSEGQRHRFALARLIARVALCEAGDDEMRVVIADEFLTPLDRTTAAAVAHAIARWARKDGIILIAATAHDDLLEALDPDVLIDASPSGIEITPG